MRAVSVVVAAHDAEAEVRVLLDSLCASEFSDFDVCLCDDGSSDGTLAAVRSYADRLDLKIASHGKNMGVTSARNTALGLAKAPLLLFLDADVRLAADTIGLLVEGRARTQADVYEGVYSPVALDAGFCSAYYALFAHHSFLTAKGPVPYDVFNAWCALCRREVMDALGGHREVPRGVEIENESLGRRIVARGFKLILDPSVAVDHHWGGARKLLFIATSRVYWWVKVFFAADRRFEDCLTTPSYAISTLSLPLALVVSVHSLPLAGLCLLVFTFGYWPFYRFAWCQKGFLFCLGSVVLSMCLSFIISASAAYSAAEEVLRRAFTGRYTLDPSSFTA